jgi:hypothetical protein
MKESIAQRDVVQNARKTAYNSGLIRCYTGTAPADVATAQTALTGTLLGTLTFGATAFGSSSGGVLTANAITQDSAADANGTIGYVACMASNGTTVISLHSVGVGSGEFQFNTLLAAVGQPISCTSCTITQPDGA